MDATELRTLYEKCILFNQFLIEKGVIPDELLNTFNESTKLLKNAYETGKIKHLKAASNDIDSEVLRYMPLPMRLELNSFFKAKLGIDFDVFAKARLKSIEKILKRGKIKDVLEYELIVDHIDEIHEDVNKINEISKLKELLITYDNTK